MTVTHTGFEVRKIGGRIGAEIGIVVPAVRRRHAVAGSNAPDPGTAT